MKSKKKIVIAFLMVFFYVLPFVIANGAGNEVEKTIDGFAFEFGVDPREPKVNEKTTMSLSVHNDSTEKNLETEDLWIRISKNNEILFSSSDFRITERSPMFLGYIFKESGKHIIDFSVKHNGKEIKTSFIVEVKRNKIVLKDLAILIAMFIFGFIAANILNEIGLTKSNKNGKKDLKK